MGEIENDDAQVFESVREALSATRRAGLDMIDEFHGEVY